MASRSMITATTMSQVGATSYKRQILPNDKRLQLKGKCATCQMEFLKHRVKKGGKEDVLLTDRYCKPCWQKRRETRRSGTAQPLNQVESSEASGFAKAEEFPYLAALEAEESSPDSVELLAFNSGTQRDLSVPMPHHIFDGTR